MHTDSFSQVSLFNAGRQIIGKIHRHNHSIRNSDTLYKKTSASLIDEISVLLSDRVMTNSEIRKSNLEILISESGSLVALAERIGHNSTAQISQWRKGAPDSKTKKPRTIGNVSARKLELLCGKPVGWMDELHGYDTTRTTTALTAEQAEILYTWSVLLPEERADVERRAAHNKAVLAMLGAKDTLDSNPPDPLKVPPKQPLQRPATATGGASSSLPPYSKNKKKKDAA